MEKLTRQNFKKLKDMPAGRIEVNVDKQFVKEDFEKIKQGIKSYDMDQRWNIFLRTIFYICIVIGLAFVFSLANLLLAITDMSI